MTLNREDVDEILRIIDQSSAKEFRLEYEGFKLVVRRDGAADSENPSVIDTSAPSPASATPPPATEAASAMGAAPVTSAERPPPSPTAVAVPAPLSGTFYQAPAPDADPFVAEGDRVTAKDTVCIIEVMKVMNTLKAPTAGTVVRIDVGDAQSVTLGQALMWVEPEGASG